MNCALPGRASFNGCASRRGGGASRIKGSAPSAEMETPPMEIEAKFAVPRLDPIRSQLLDRSARLVLPRLQETNLRFYDADGRLRREGRGVGLPRHGERT